MKKVLLAVAVVFSLNMANAQQKNILLQTDFWKKNPDVEAVKAEIAKGNDPAQLDMRQMDPTSLAINAEAPLATIKFMVTQKGNSVTKGTHHSRTYLHWAVAKGNLDLMNYLITKGADINKGDSYGTPPVAYAAATGQQNTAVYEVFFKLGIDPKKKYNNGANLLLSSIAADKDLKLATYFASKGMSLNDVDADGATAFDYAARTGNTDFLKTLAAKGVKATANALYNASLGGRNTASSLAVYQYLVDDFKLDAKFTNKEGNNVLHAIVRKPNQEEIINYFLAKGVTINQANEEGNTPFLNAAAGKNTVLVERLLPLVSNINAVNAKGESALTLAVSNGSPEMVALLLAKGADVKVLDTDGNNLLYYLVQHYRSSPMGAATPAKDEFAEKLAILTAKGLSVNTLQKDGSSLFHVAIAKSDLRLLQKIAALNVDVNAKNKEGLTVLHRAALLAKNDEILKYLVSIGANKSIKTDFDETAFDLAAENKFLTTNKIAIDFLK